MLGAIHQRRPVKIGVGEPMWTTMLEEGWWGEIETQNILRFTRLCTSFQADDVAQGGSKKSLFSRTSLIDDPLIVT